MAYITTDIHIEIENRYDTEQVYDLIKSKDVRIICKRRARVLRKRGEYVVWSKELHSWIWLPSGHWYFDRPKFYSRLPEETKQQLSYWWRTIQELEVRRHRPLSRIRDET